MKKSLLRTLTLALLVVVCVTMLAACPGNEVVVPVTLERGNFEQRMEIDDLEFKTTEVDGLPSGYMAIDSDIAQGTDQLEAVLHLMAVAENNYYTADYLARYSDGGGSASAGPMMGKMTVRSLSIREADKSYYQTVGRIYEGDPEFLLGAAQLLLDQGKRTYTLNLGTPDEVTYRQEPKNKGNPAMTETFPFATCNFSKGKLETIDAEHPDEENDFSLKYPGELTNFVISEESLLEDSYSVVYDEEYGYYTVSFAVDTSLDDNGIELYGERPQASLRKSAGSDDLYHVYYRATFVIFDNGLLKTFQSEESWDATINIGGGIHGASSSLNTDYYSWDPDDCEIEDYVEEGIIALDWVPQD
jgi:hypothetical protein